jgi:isocitrate dehydrogenase (NAD+)
MQLVTNPYQYDVLVLENLYGDIVSDLCAAFVGGLGLVPGANIGEGCAIFEAVHGSAPDIAGRNIANPTALLRCAIQMLRHIGEKEVADRLKQAMYQVYKEKRCLTRDMGGNSSTMEFAEAVVEAFCSGRDARVHAAG